MSIENFHSNREPLIQQKPSSWLKEAKSLLAIISIALAIRTLCFELFYVPTASMKAAILEGDYIFSTKYDYGYSKYSLPFNLDLFSGRIFSAEPTPGDVIIMRPPYNMSERYIKRLIAIPGDKIQIIDDLIYINNEPIRRIEIGLYIDEAGKEFVKFQETLPNGVTYFSYKMKYPPEDWDAEQHRNFGPYFVENGHYFFMGDNRDNSGDSRYQLGTVPMENLIGKGRFVIFSTKIPLWNSKESFVGQVARIWDWLVSIRFKRLFTSLYE